MRFSLPMGSRARRRRRKSGGVSPARKVTSSLFDLSHESVDALSDCGPLALPYLHPSEIVEWLETASKADADRGMTEFLVRADPNYFGQVKYKDNYL